MHSATIEYRPAQGSGRYSCSSQLDKVNHGDSEAALEAMMTLRKLLATAAVVGAAVGAKIGIDRLRHSSRAESTVADLRRRGRHWVGQAKGFTYHALRRHPDVNVDDATLADRVRSSIGPLEKRLHVPHVLVTVENGTVILHGEIPNSEAETEIVNAIDGIAGVHEVRSHLTSA
ncbi:BON domain-containing protein [Kribbella pittospori]|uniref:BON domain-containing protein n=1 Tax=Kribbella pittospori TaxID=722689 RepID=A0A4R0JIK6_9ACTN|nr:BON domain-containing protein [Kribbella pittospori]